MFFRRKSTDPQEALDMASKIASGKGLMGRITKSMIGDEMAQQLQQSVDLVQQTQHNEALLNAGVPTVSAAVVSVVDTGGSVNDDPIVVLTAELQSGSQIAVQTLVSRIAIPRQGDTIRLIENPPSVFSYVGISQGG